MSKPKTQKAPPPPAPMATPEVAGETEDFAMKRARRYSGFKKTILTGSLTPNSGKNLLG